MVSLSGKGSGYPDAHCYLADIGAAAGISMAVGEKSLILGKL
jgi:hypothetical protein